MRIQSKWRDYYDHVSHEYGIDPDVLYERKPLTNTKVSWDNRGTLLATLGSRWWWEYRKQHARDYTTMSMRFLVVGSLVVPVIATGGSAALREQLTVLGPEHEHMLESMRWHQNPTKYPSLPREDHLAELTRLVGAPVYLVCRVDGGVVELDERVPILSDVSRFPAAHPAEQVWQDIYATLTNVLRKNPDKAPPAVVEEKYRIEAAGFDLKTSFRDPVNQLPRGSRRSRKKCKKDLTP